jgi:ElaB/YqjD/DUF883 family membrane-anchored ribosome-binding protein
VRIDPGDPRECNVMSSSHQTRTEAPDQDEAPARLDPMEIFALLGRDLRRVQDELEAACASAPWPSAPDVASAAQELKRSIAGFIEKAHATTDTVGRKAAVETRKLREQVEKHPVAAVSSALALGYFLGRTVFSHERRADQRDEQDAAAS